MKTKKVRGTIEDTTPILPFVIADAVVGELSRYLYLQHGFELEDAGGLADAVSDKAEHLYQVNDSVYRKIRGKGNAGRDYLYTFMCHWLCGELTDRRTAHPSYGKALALLPYGFAVGSPAPRVEVRP